MQRNAIKKDFYYDADSAKTVNMLARKKMIEKLLLDIKTDLMICEIEGWSKIEYLQELKIVINSFSGGSDGQKRI